MSGKLGENASVDEPFDLSFFAGPDTLAKHLNALYYFTTRVPVFEEIMPAYSPQLVLISRGSVSADLGDGMREFSGAIFMTQLSRAVPFRLNGPFEAVAASLKVHGWAALTRKPMDEWKNRVVPVSEVLDAEPADKINHIVAALKDGAMERGTASDALAKTISEHVASLPEPHEQFVLDMQNWLTSGIELDLDVLRQRLDLPDRQIQRLAKRYFGSSPASMIKRYRAVLCASLLARETLPDETANLIRSVYFDQAHLIRDIQKFTGKTPKMIQSDLEGMSAKSLGPDGFEGAELFDNISRQSDSISDEG